MGVGVELVGPAAWAMALEASCILELMRFPNV
jgi:hypothetical protein